jgi:hypothetical protein
MTLLPVPQAREMLVDGSMKRGDSKGRIVMEASSHKLRATGFGRAGCVSVSQLLDQPAGVASNQSKRWRRGWSVGREKQGDAA